MKKWILKAIVQKTISFLPKANKINNLFQKYVTKGFYLTDEYFFDRLEHAQVHLKEYASFTNNFVPNSCLELGTGWYPVIPIAFYLAGVKNIHTVDISSLIKKEWIKITTAKFIEAYESKKLEDYIKVDENRYEKIMFIHNNIDSLELKDVLDKLHLKYHVEDARKLHFQDGSIDLINSNNTFEHIEQEVLKSILKEFKRIINKKHGVMSHFIDMSDHFAHFDKSINIYNFLRFSDKQWKLIDNTIQPQNRLRIDDYRSIYQELNIPISKESFRKGNIDEVNDIKLNQKFKSKPIKTIAISHCNFTSKFS